MAVLHKEFITFNREIRLSDSRKESLRISRNNLRKQIRKWFEENRPKELQPKFRSQGSIEMNTANNPIPLYDEDDIKLLKYDIDDGIYFIEKAGEDNKRSIETWHDWIFQAVENYTSIPPIRKSTCIRVIFADGHHIDLPIYYKMDDKIKLAHKTKGWIESDPKKFFKWFREEKNAQLERIVRYFKAWKNYREFYNSSLKLPSGFELTILATNNYIEDDNDDFAFRETVRKINIELNKPDGFKCIRPTTPEGENVFEGYSESRRTNFLNTLSNLLKDLDKARDEKNFRNASEILRDNQFGNRFPWGEDKDEEVKSKELGAVICSASIVPKPYGY